ncbi:MAG: 30S ribosomal protein S1 [Planctomycetota bacterium]
MPNPDLLKDLGIKEESINKEVEETLGEGAEETLKKAYEESIKDFEADTILKGRIIGTQGDDVILDVGYKSEGVVSRNEFLNPAEIVIGKEIEVFLDSVEDDAGLISISKSKADRIRGWERIISSNKEGDVVRGRVIRKIKGGLLVDIGVPVFLPASQVNVRRVEDIGEFVGREVECKIIKIDEKRMNIIVSRRRLLEEQREEMKKKVLEDLKVADIVTGVVKNIADFGVFVDLGGIDGLLHITDMSWGRVNHPSDMVHIDQTLQVKVLKIDKTTERIALGLKQLTENPWAKVENKYPVGTKCKGRTVNILPYGAFVEMEPGVEGLVHISEMSWTKRVNHPSEVVSIGDIVDVQVLNINREKQEISLGMKQTEVNPWSLVEQKYPVGTLIEGKVRNLTNYGAFVEIEEGIDGLLHVSDMSWTKKVVHPSEMLKKGDSVKAKVLTVDAEKKRVALGTKQLEDNPWESRIPDKYRVGTTVVGKVTKLTNFGAFVELEANLEGLLHVSKLTGDVQSPEQVLSQGDVVEVQVIRLEPSEGKIGLSMVRMIESQKKKAPPTGPIQGDISHPPEEPPKEEPAAVPDAPDAPDAPEAPAPQA